MRNKLGGKEIIACIGGATLFVLAAMMMSVIFPYGTMSGLGDYFNVSVSILAVVSAIFGPFVGAVIGFGGAMITDIMLAGQVYLIDAIAACIYGILIGMFSEKFMVLEGEFNIARLGEYAAIVTFSGIINWLLFCPFASCLYRTSNLYTTLSRGFRVFVGSSMGAVVLGAIAMSVTSKLIYSQKQRYVYTEREFYNNHG